MARIFILNDLFVAGEARGRGAGSALLDAAAAYGRSAGAVRLVLSTEVTNTTAQSVYEKLGWKRDSVFCVYQLRCERQVGIGIRAWPERTLRPRFFHKGPL